MAGYKFSTKPVDKDRLPHIKYKVVLLGDTNVGKTCIIRSLLREKFITSQASTIGIDFRRVFFNIRDVELALDIWDTAGQEHFRSFTSSYLRNVDGFILVFSINKEFTFQKLQEYLEQEVNEIIESKETKVPFLVVGNKLDLRNDLSHVDHDNLSYKEFETKSEKLGADGYYEVSAKTGEGIEEMFFTLADKILINNHPHCIPGCIPNDEIISKQLQKCFKCKCDCKFCLKCVEKKNINAATSSTMESYYSKTLTKINNKSYSTIKLSENVKKKRNKNSCFGRH